MKRAIAALVSIFIPGLGQLGLGRGKRAAVFLSVSVITFFVFWVVPLPEKFAGLILGKLIAGFIATAAAIEALLLPWKGISVRTAALLLLIIPLGFWGGTVPTGIANLHHDFRAFTVTNTAMEPTLHVRDRFVTEFPKNPVRRGDVIAFKHEGVLTMKRVIGVAGDTPAHDLRGVIAACKSNTFAIAVLSQVLLAGEKQRISETVQELCPAAKILELRNAIMPDLPGAHGHLRVATSQPEGLRTSG